MPVFVLTNFTYCLNSEAQKLLVSLSADNRKTYILELSSCNILVHVLSREILARVPMLPNFLKNMCPCSAAMGLVAGIGDAMPPYLWIEVIGTAVCHHYKIIACHMMVSLVEMLGYILLQE